MVYATNGQSQVAGKHTCQLMMKSMVEFIKIQPNFTFGAFDVETSVSEDYAKALQNHVGNWYGGKFPRHFQYPLFIVDELRQD